MTPTERMVSDRAAAALRQLIAKGGTPKQQRDRKARIAEVEGYVARRLNDAEGGPVPNIHDPRWAGFGKTLDDVLVAPPSAKNVTPKASR